MVSEQMNLISNKMRGIENLGPWLLLIPLTLVSFLLSGYVPLYNNNIYHTPILLETYNLPQFADDAFVQSLRYFSSGFWIVFAGSGRYLDVRIFLAVWLVITHFSILAACLHFAQSVGLKDRKQLNIFMLLISCSPLIYGVTAGGGGMMLNYFSHSELANAGLLLGLSYAIRGRYGSCAVMFCITFFLNAFMAVWMVPSLVLLAAYHLWSGRITLRRFLVSAISGTALGSVFLILPIVNVLQNRDNREGNAFSYPDFLWNFYPYHFFFSSLAYKELCLIGISTGGLLLTARLYGRSAVDMLMLALGCVILLVLAAIVPMVTESRMALNLHLVRGFVMIAMLVAISLAIVASRWIAEPRNSYLGSLGLIMGAALISHKYGIVIAVAAVLAEYSTRYTSISVSLLRRKSAGLIISIFCIGSLVALPIRSAGAMYESIEGISDESAWERVGAWANSSTPPDSIFQVLHDGAAGFSYTSNRRLWFDFKYGAAVMWSPSYHQIWQARRASGADLSDIERLHDESDGQINYVALECDARIAKPPEFTDGGICVYKTN